MNEENNWHAFGVATHLCGAECSKQFIKDVLEFCDNEAKQFILALAAEIQRQEDK